jgi:nitrate reductase (NAD(P)H)
LQKHRWVPVKLVDRKAVSEDTRTYTFELPDGKRELGLGTCQHIQVGFHLEDKMLVRPYTPTWPVMPSPRTVAAEATTNPREKDTQQGTRPQPPTPPHSPPNDNNSNQTPPATFDLTIKTYFPTAAQPGGALSNLLDCMPLGEEVEIRGPTGDIVYLGDSTFLITGPLSPQPRKMRFPRVSLVLGGSGITPGYALMAAIVGREGDATRVRAVDANKAEGDILLREDLEEFGRRSDGRVAVTHVLSHAGEGWQGERGLVNGEVLRRCLFPPEEGNAVFLCGPPGLVQKAALPALKGMSVPEVDGGSGRMLTDSCKQNGGMLRMRICLGFRAVWSKQRPA